jgi:phospholipid/cholesterol/gamma-HCH transport system substrate-binding protein
MDDLMLQVKDMVEGLRGSVRSVNEILSNPKTRRSVEEIVENVRLTTEQAALLTREVRQLMGASGPKLDRLISDASGAARDFAALGRDLRSALASGDGAQLQKALASAARAAQNLEAASERLRKLAEDEKMEADIRQTLASAREAAQGAADVVDRLQKIVGPRGRGATGAPSKQAPGLGSRLDLFGKTDGGDLRVDYNFTLPGPRDAFYRVGLFDIGEGTKVNLQRGRMLDERSALRYGLYASRIGIGYDQRLGDRLDLQLDLYRPNDPRLEAKLRYRIRDNFGAWIGLEDVFGDGGALIGLQFRP